MEKWKVFIVDDHPVLRKGLKALVSELSNCTVVGESEGGHEAVKKIVETRPDIVIMDISMPDLDGIRVTKMLLEKNEKVKIIIFSMHQSQHYVFEAFRAGASGYVVKGSDTGEIMTAINTVMEGRQYASPQVKDIMLSDYVNIIRKDKALEPFDSLTAREKDILRLVADGDTNKEIAEKLFIAESTVKSHRIKIMEKLNVRDTAAMIRIAIQKGLAKAE